MARQNRGDAFLREKTGSATMVNLDGRWEHDFMNDDTPAGDKQATATKESIKKM